MIQASKLIDPIPKGFFKNNRKRLLNVIRNSQKFESKGLLFLSGPETQKRNDDDAPIRIWPEPFFYYLFGIKDELNTYCFIELETEKVVLFTKLLDIEEQKWSRPKSLEDFKRIYEIDEAHSLDHLPVYLNEQLSKECTIYLNTGVCPTSGRPTATPEATFEKELKEHKVNKTLLYPYGREARVLKSADEVNLMRSAIKVSTFAHMRVMKSIQEGMSEKQLSDFFTAVNQMYNSDIPYSNIFGAGENGSILHYFPSPSVFFKSGQLVLNDSGSKIHCYNSDITRTFPVNGKFTEKQRQIYNLVLGAQAKALEITLPGKDWIDSHNAAVKFIVEGLCGLKLVVGDPKKALEAGVGKVFMPHGLGHYIGLYVHDMPGLEQMNVVPHKEHLGCDGKISRKLEAGMVITVEPGIYLNKVILERSYNDQKLKDFLNKSVIDEYVKEVGGVRIEDMYLITETSFEDLSKGLIKTVNEIESFMSK